MKRLLQTLLITAGLALHAEPQTWRSTGGHTFQGEFVRLENHAVMLKGVDGREVTVPLNSLDDESRARAQAAAGTNPSRGQNAALFRHETPNYRFTLTPGTKPVELVFLEAGRPVNLEPFILEVVNHEIHGKDWKFIPFREMESPLLQEKDRVT